MKKAAFVLVAGTLVSASALAQSNITLYGGVDVSLRYMSNTNAVSKSLVQMTDGPIYASRWGIRGTEDLGGGLSSIFVLENGFGADTGAMSSTTNQLFNRQSYVGLRSKLGQVTLGRQYSLVHEMLAQFDPLQLGISAENSFFVGRQYTPRLDNTVRYSGTVGGFTGAGSYSVGEQPDSQAKGRTMAASAIYRTGALGLAASYQQERDALTDRERDAWGGGASWTDGALKLSATYLGSNDKRITIAPRRDNTYAVGAAYRTGAWMFSGAVYHDRMELAGQAGKHSTLGLLADYSLSKRTVLYAYTDYTKVSGGALVDLNAVAKVGGTDDTRLTTSFGIRHLF